MMNQMSLMSKKTNNAKRTTMRKNAKLLTMRQLNNKSKGCMAQASLLQEYKVTTSEDVNIRLIWWAVFRGDRCGSNLVGLV